MQGRLILVHLMCHDMAPFQAENVDEDKATGKKKIFCIFFFFGSSIYYGALNACAKSIGMKKKKKKGVELFNNLFMSIKSTQLQLLRQQFIELHHWAKELCYC